MGPVPWAAAQDPRPEVLPTPEGLVPADGMPPLLLPPGPPLPAYQRTSRMAVWQYYAVDRFHHFRPVVVYGPQGAYYAYDGKPYPWVTNHFRDFMPYVVDSP
jgi:hypothetical protein